MIQKVAYLVVKLVSLLELHLAVMMVAYSGWLKVERKALLKVDAMVFHLVAS